MTVYVDWLMHHGWVLRGRTVRSCHMFGDDLEELHQMAETIGMKRSWFQNKRLPHYDLTESRRNLAIRNGAVELTRSTWREAAGRCGYRNAQKQHKDG